MRNGNSQSGASDDGFTLHVTHYAFHKTGCSLFERMSDCLFEVADGHHLKAVDGRMTATPRGHKAPLKSNPLGLMEPL